MEVCNAVLDVSKPPKDHKVIINIPTSVQVAMPHVFACQVEYIHKNLKYRDAVSLSVHPHNDRGCGVSDAEFGILAGADRVEGTLFGNGERTGNVDIVTVALNMVCHGVNPGLDFSHIMKTRETYEMLTGMKVPERSPYSGDLVFTAFSGSHQDAISKGMAWRNEGKSGKKWTVPYLPIDPVDLGREYESDVIRINSQSGKGGIAFILKQNFGISLPEKMKDEVRYLVKHASDENHKELSPAEIYQLFEDNYVTRKPVFDIPLCRFEQADGIHAEITIEQNKEKRVIETSGNGRLDAVSNAIKVYFGIDYELTYYEEHAISKGSSSKAAAFVGLVCDGRTYWGVGIDEDIIKSSIAALVTASNQIAESKHAVSGREERIVDILNYIQMHYQTVTLDELADKFSLSTPYLSKYIKEKSGKTFQDTVKDIRFGKARLLLKETTQTVEAIATEVGYENVEHFNRLFKKTYGCTPMQYRSGKQ